MRSSSNSIFGSCLSLARGWVKFKRAKPKQGKLVQARLVYTPTYHYYKETIVFTTKSLQIKYKASLCQTKFHKTLSKLCFIFPQYHIHGHTCNSTICTTLLYLWCGGRDMYVCSDVVVMHGVNLSTLWILYPKYILTNLAYDTIIQVLRI